MSTLRVNRIQAVDESVLNFDTGNINSSGIVTATSFVGDGSSLTGIVSIPSGSVFYFPANSLPSGFLKANGATISRTTYADLFAVIGTTYGAGDGSTTFQLPDLRGEFIRGWDDSRGVDSGRSFGSSQSGATALPNNPFGTSNPGNHTHSYSDFYNGNGGGQGGGGANTGTVSTGRNTGGNGSHTHTINGGDTETRPRNVALLALIKY